MHDVVYGALCSSHCGIVEGHQEPSHEDNDAAIKMVGKQRWPQLRHVVRSHQINLDWLVLCLAQDPGIFI